VGDWLRGPKVFLDISMKKNLLVSRFRRWGVKECRSNQRDGAVGTAIGQPIAIDVIDNHACTSDQGDGGPTGKTRLSR
jgi:hypothetical protein